MTEPRYNPEERFADPIHTRQERIEEEIPESPVAPGDVASAARSCQAIIIILLVLALIACLIVAVTLLR